MSEKLLVSLLAKKIKFIAMAAHTHTKKRLTTFAELAFFMPLFNALIPSIILHAAYCAAMGEKLYIYIYIKSASLFIFLFKEILKGQAQC